MEKKESQNIQIPRWVQQALEKRDSLIREQEGEINKIQESGRARQQDITRISRRSSSIESFDTRLLRSGFFPPQRIQPTSKTTHIVPDQLQFEQSSGFNISPRRSGGGGGSTEFTHPFKVITRNIGGIWKWGVVSISRVFDFVGIDPIIPSGVLLLQNPDNEDPNWKDIDITKKDYIYLERDILGESTQIKTTQSDGGSFIPSTQIGTSANGYIETDMQKIPPEQKFARKIIASTSFFADITQPPVVIQGVYSNQCLFDMCIDGVSVRYWIDYSSGGV
jgi:hypothetical protein